MYSIPIGMVVKPHYTSFQLVTDHSVRKFALNSFITKEDLTICLDNLQGFGTALCAVVARDSCPQPGCSNWWYHQPTNESQYTLCGKLNRSTHLRACDM